MRELGRNDLAAYLLGQKPYHQGLVTDWYNGEQFVYEEDFKKAKEAEENLKDLELDNYIADLESQIASLESEIEKETEVISNQIDALQNYKQQWLDVANQYTEAQEDMYASQVLGANWENEILNMRSENLASFTNAYISAQQAMADAAWRSANEQIRAAKEAAKGAGGSEGGGGTVGGKYEVVYEGDASTVKIFDSKEAAQKYANNMSEGIDDDEPSYYVKAKKYHTGLEQGYVGDSLSDDKRLDIIRKASLTPLKDGEVPAILEKKELVFTEEQQKALVSNLLNMPNTIADSMINNLSKNAMPNLNMSRDLTPIMNLSIGDIKLYGVQDVDGLSKAIVNQLPNKVMQALYKK